MGININDLPPWAQKQVAVKLAEENARRSESTQESRKSTGKYHNIPTTRNGSEGKTMRFDSKKEAARFDELMFLLNSGEISDLRLQADFTLQEAYTTPEGNRIRAIRYKADFTYKDRNGRLVVEDIKGGSATKTKVYIMKKKLMRDKFGIDIREID